MRAIFLDRDGTVNVGIPKYEYVDSVDKVELLPSSLQALTLLSKMNYGVFFVTNQLGFSKGLITKEDFHTINGRVLELIKPSGINIIETYLCPHGSEEHCNCRKPKPKMLLDAANEYGIDLNNSYMIGDRLTDIQTGINAGTKTIQVQTGEKTKSDKADYIATDLLVAVQYIAKQ